MGAESRRYASAFITSLKQRGDVGQVLIGRDLRDSSAAISQDVAAALAAAGAEAVDCGEVPTPALALEAMSISLQLPR